MSWGVYRVRIFSFLDEQSVCCLRSEWDDVPVAESERVDDSCGDVTFAATFVEDAVLAADTFGGSVVVEFVVRAVWSWTLVVWSELFDDGDVGDGFGLLSAGEPVVFGFEVGVEVHVVPARIVPFFRINVGGGSDLGPMIDDHIEVLLIDIHGLVIGFLRWCLESPSVVGCCCGKDDYEGAEGKED